MKVLYTKLKNHLIDTTAVATAMNPLMAGVEVGAAGMTNETSMHARLLGSVLLYAGLGSVYSQGRDLSKKLFGITKETSEVVKTIHDSAYTFAFTVALQPPFYYVVGSRNVKEIIIGTIGAGAISSLFGPVTGYMVDTYRDFTDIKGTERLPSFLKNHDPTTKKYMAGLLTAASVGLLAGIYAMNK